MNNVQQNQQNQMPNMNNVQQNQNNNGINYTNLSSPVIEVVNDSNQDINNEENVDMDNGIILNEDQININAMNHLERMGQEEILEFGGLNL